jgi:hypothetical protein
MILTKTLSLLFGIPSQKFHRWVAIILRWHNQYCSFAVPFGRKPRPSRVKWPVPNEKGAKCRWYEICQQMFPLFRWTAIETYWSNVILRKDSAFVGSFLFSETVAILHNERFCHGNLHKKVPLSDIELNGQGLDLTEYWSLTGDSPNLRRALGDVDRPLRWAEHRNFVVSDEHWMLYWRHMGLLSDIDHKRTSGSVCWRLRRQLNFTMFSRWFEYSLNWFTFEDQNQILFCKRAPQIKWRIRSMLIRFRGIGNGTKTERVPDRIAFSTSVSSIDWICMDYWSGTITNSMWSLKDTDSHCWIDVVMLCFNSKGNP